MQPDRRRVQTAVTGDPHSAEPAYMPTDPDEAEQFRDRARERAQTHWCGLLLGGCGGRLSLKIVREREAVPHFSHNAGSNLCARLARGGEATRGGHSADHLYANRHLRAWLAEHERAVEAPAQYLGLDRGRGCTELIVPTTAKPLRLVFSHDLDHELLALAKSPQARDYVWLVRANQSVTSALFANRVPHRLFRLSDSDGAEHSRAVQVGIRDGAGKVEWVPLAKCVLRGGTLVKAVPAAAAPLPRPESEPFREREEVDPLEQALRGLRHALAEGDSRANVSTMADRVRLQLRAARVRGLAPDLAVEARNLLDQAADVLNPQQDAKASGLTRGQAQEEVRNRQVQSYREYERQEERYRQTARQVDQLVGKLAWAKENERSRVYQDNRVQLVEMLNRPDTPKHIADRIKQQLLIYPKDLFTAPAPTPGPRPRSRSGQRGSDRRGRREAQTPAVPAPARPVRQAEKLEVSARIDQRSRELLRELRASGQRPVPRQPPTQ
ncbi:hypothetical protein ABZ234_08595 [Nocardiopsis sp. NPDC006198]|uniref:hypothetical protein n=1 Tax=Nocardiopsis sp. NPDC006198 TaxID=3154472 RepID=UPI0033A01322